MNATIAKTYRMPAGVNHLILNAAERLKTSEADIVRMALRHYFDDQQLQVYISASEQRVLERIQAQGERLGQLMGEILKLAQPA